MWVVDVVDAPAGVRPAVEQLRSTGVAPVPDADRAVALVGRRNGVTAVTADGVVFSPGFVRGKVAAPPRA